MTLLVTYLLLTLILSFMCSLLEATLLSSTSSYIESLDKKGYSPKTVDLAKDVKQNIDKSISSILTLNTFANTMGAAGVGAQAAIIFGSNWQAVIAFALTLMVLFISEIFPKTLGAIYWRKFIVPAVYIISFMVKITYPFIFLATFITNTLQKGRKNEVNFSKDEIITIVNMSEKEGVLQAKESILIKNLFKLKNIKAKDIMTPRTVVFAFDSKTTLKEALLNDNLYVYSRIPVYNESIDDIAGVVFKQTILELLSEGSFKISYHAHIRMNERNVTTEDIKECGKTAYRFAQQDPYKFRIDGMDLNNDELTVVCAFKNDLLIVTVY